MLSGHLTKLADATVFAGLFFINFEYFWSQPYFFDVVALAAMAYVVVRKRDANTISLILLIVLADSISFLLTSVADQNGYVVYGGLLVIASSMTMVIKHRASLLSNYGPSSIKNKATLKLTYQDGLITLMYGFQAVLQFAALMEHSFRHLDDFGLEGLFGDWKPMLFYTMYRIQLFGFSVFSLVIFYFMTFDKSKAELRL